MKEPAARTQGTHCSEGAGSSFTGHTLQRRSRQLVHRAHTAAKEPAARSQGTHCSEGAGSSCTGHTLQRRSRQLVHRAHTAAKEPAARQQGTHCSEGGSSRAVRNGDRPRQRPRTAHCGAVWEHFYRLSRIYLCYYTFLQWKMADRQNYLNAGTKLDTPPIVGAERLADVRN